MATQLFLRMADQNVANLVKTSTRMWQMRGRGCIVAPGGPGALLTTRGGASVGLGGFATVAGPTSGQFLSPAVYGWHTAPLAAAVTISGTITCNIRGFESAMNANAAWQVRIYRIRPDGTPTQIGISGAVAEMGTSDGASNFNITPTSTAFLVGDVIGVYVLIDDGNGVTMASGFNVTLSVDGPTAGAAGDTYVTFTENLSFVTSGSGSILYPHDTAVVGLVVPGIDARRLHIGSSIPGAQNYVTNSVAGQTSRVQATRSAGGTPVFWYSDPLEEQVGMAGGAATVDLAATVSSTAANARVLAELCICDGDGGNPEVIMYAEQNFGDTLLEVGTSDTTPITWAPINSRDIARGQRLRLGIYWDDMLFGENPHPFGINAEQAGNYMASGHTMTVALGSGTAIDLSFAITGSAGFKQQQPSWAGQGNGGGPGQIKRLKRARDDWALVPNIAAHREPPRRGVGV